MAEFVFNDVIRSKSGEYFLRTANSIYQHRVISSFFRNGTLLDSQNREYDTNLSEETLLDLTRGFHEEKKSEVKSLLDLSEKLKQAKQPETKNLLGLAFMRKGMFNEAIDEFEDAIVLDPENSIIYNNLGNAYIEVERLEEAIDVLEKAILLSPDFADLHNNLGRAYLKMSQCKNAVGAFEKAISINTYYPDAYYNLALAYILNAHTREDFALSVDCYTKVMEYMEKAARINPNFKNEYFERGEEFLRRNEYLSAYQEFEKGYGSGAQTNDMSFILDFYLRVIHSGKKLRSSMIWRHIRRLEALLKKYPNYADLYNHLGVAYVIMSKIVNNKAIQLFDQAMKINPNFEKAKRNKRLAEYDHKGIQLLFDAILK
ncbi:MAG: tetratricopeptide repeat protein [Deferribacteres bacterium]|nr:tetratricopeptide repeat protein [candidate division KSB1 bacterium]MCB9510854.1 tetratricopeptide repeat protein [Deferribacteres bacterium]